MGARSGRLAHVLDKKVCFYVALDIGPPADVIANVELGLPFKDQTFDVVVALDVLEHTDRLHRALKELRRVARGFVVLSLPNAYALDYRLKLLRGLALSGKYGLPLEPLVDRHRWLFSLNESRRFCALRPLRHGFRLTGEGALVDPRRGVWPINKLVSTFPNLMAPTYLALLQRVR